MNSKKPFKLKLSSTGPAKTANAEAHFRNLTNRHPDVKHIWSHQADILRASDEDGGYITDIPDLRYCSAFGATPDEALAEVLKAKKAWLKAARAAKKTIPIPSFRPDIYRVSVGSLHDQPSP